jgi:hypothetical protein
MKSLLHQFRKDPFSNPPKNEQELLDGLNHFSIPKKYLE